MTGSSWMQRLLLIAAVVLAAAGLVWAFSAKPALTSGLPPSDLQRLAKLSEAERSAELARIAERTATTHSLPQPLLVQRVEGDHVIVVAAAQEDSDSPPAVGWEIPWKVVVDAIRKAPTELVTASSRYAGLALHHEIYPVAADEGLYLLLNTSAAPAGFRTGPLLLLAGAGLLAALALRQFAQ